MSDQLDEDAIVGCLLGQAIGDMMGLPAENLSPRRVAKLFPKLDRPRFLFGYGMGSDDTEHACLTAQAILRSGGDVERFRRSLAWGLRWWFAAGPPGIGLATAKACVRMWLGFREPGVRSAGNGPAMRAAVIGAVLKGDLQRRCVDTCTRLTHTDPLAAAGARAVALFTRHTADRFDPLAYGARFLFEAAAEPGAEGDLKANLVSAAATLETGRSVAEFASDIGLSHGVSGYIAHSVPVAVYAFLRHPDDYRTAVESVIRLGGDTDTVAAITGALVGARVGKAGIPKEWLERYIDWPRSVAHMEELGRRLAEGRWRTQPQPGVRIAWWAVPVRNLVFFLVVLGHIVRRVLPPY